LRSDWLGGFGFVFINADPAFSVSVMAGFGPDDAGTGALVASAGLACSGSLMAE
jgi:hypothetical protein